MNSTTSLLVIGIHKGDSDEQHNIVVGDWHTQGRFVRRLYYQYKELKIKEIISFDRNIKT